MQEKLTDPIDIGSQTAQDYLDDGIKATRMLVPEERINEPEEEPECEMCGLTFPMKRYMLGYNMCVQCSHELAHYNKGYRKAEYD